MITNVLEHHVNLVKWEIELGCFSKMRLCVIDYHLTGTPCIEMNENVFPTSEFTVDCVVTIPRAKLNAFVRGTV